MLAADTLAKLRGPLLAAVSGGADSVALLRLLCEERDRRPDDLTLYAIHVNHGLRGADADADEAFVLALCGRLRVPCRAVRLTPPAHPSEDWAREARYRALTAEARRLGAAVVLAHHSRDQAETLLLHLLRGSGLNGLCGMRPVSGRDGVTLLRPLLAVSPEALRAYLTRLGQDWREDASNAADDYLRNRVRHHLLPMMEELAPGAAGRLAGTAERLRADEEALAAAAEHFLTAHSAERLLDKPATALQPEGLRARILRQWVLRETGLVPDEPHTRQLTRLLQTTGVPAELGHGWSVYGGTAYLHLLNTRDAPPPREELPLTGPGTYTLGQATVTVTRAAAMRGAGKTFQYIPEDMADGLVLRTRRTGDRLRPFGQKGSQSLQDYLVNRHVDAPFRDRLPLLCRGSEVLWVAGIGGGDVPDVTGRSGLYRLELGGVCPWCDAKQSD